MTGLMQHPVNMISATADAIMYKHHFNIVGGEMEPSLSILYKYSTYVSES